MPGLGDGFVGGLDDWQQLMLAGGQLPQSSGFPKAPATDELGRPIAPDVFPTADPGSVARSMVQAIGPAPADPFATGAAPIPAVPGLPKTAQEAAAELSAQRGNFSPGEFMLNLGGGPAGGSAALALAPIAGAARKALAGGAGRVAAEAVSAPNIIVPQRQTISPVSWSAERYPAAGAFEMRPKGKDAPGEFYKGKTWTPEESAIAQRRDVATGNIKSGNWDPYFNVEQRSMVDPAGYPGYDPTLTQRGAETKSGLEALRKRLIDIQGAEPKLMQAYQAGEAKPGAHGFYAMKQWEDQYIKEFGLEEGRKRFQRDFAESMAGTTSGNTPEMNFIVGQRANWMARQGEPFPPRGEAAGPTIPYPASGAAKGVNNYNEYLQQVHEGGGLQGGGINRMTNPKKYNFAYNFVGSGGPTIDKQMMSMISNKQLEMPPTGGYGVYEQPVHNVAQKLGVDPITLQELAWAGKKLEKTPNYTPVPMMHHINTAIERTATVTGLSPDEVVKRMVRGQIPVYGIGGMGAALGAASQREDQQQWQ